MEASVSLISPPCPVCAGVDYTPVLRGARDLIWRKPGEFQIQRCAGCGLAATRPRPDDASLGFYYADTYSGDAEAGMKKFQTESGLGKLIARYRLSIIRKVYQLSKSDRLLDVGCSYGGLLRMAQTQSGCEANGLDADEGSIAEAVDQDTIDYQVGFLAEKVESYGPGRFTVVSFFESLEHHSEPVEALRAAYEILEPGGICVVEVPNFDGFWRKIFRTAWLPLLIPQHLFHFTPNSLEATFKAAGFPVMLRQQTMFFPLEGVASLGLWLGRLFRSPPPDAKPSWRTPFDISIFLVLVVLYLVTEIPSQAILRLFGVSGHQIAIAQRPEE